MPASKSQCGPVTRGRCQGQSSGRGGQGRGGQEEVHAKPTPVPRGRGQGRGGQGRGGQEEVQAKPTPVPRGRGQGRGGQGRGGQEEVQAKPTPVPRGRGQGRGGQGRGGQEEVQAKPTPVPRGRGQGRGGQGRGGQEEVHAKPTPVPRGRGQGRGGQGRGGQEEVPAKPTPVPRGRGQGRGGQEETFKWPSPPFMDADGKWVHRNKRQHVGDIGFFCCRTCSNRTWVSIYSNFDYGQKCHSCNVFRLPVLMWKNNTRDDNHNKNSSIRSKKPHPSEDCEMCQKGICKSQQGNNTQVAPQKIKGKSFHLDKLAMICF